MRFLYFLADKVFRFRYRDPHTERDGIPTWDIGIYEEEHDKMLRDFFIMGATVVGVPVLLVLTAVYVK